MRTVGLTGGIGSGKSSVSDRLRGKGIPVLDADAITKQLQEPGQPVFVAMVERFGSGIVDADGRLDRPAVAEIVFNDDESRKALNAIVHPAVGVEMARQMAELHDSPVPVVLDIPLLVEGPGRPGLAGILVVDCPVEVAVERLVTLRGLPEADARARIAAQATREERLAKADFVIDNSGSLADLDAEVARAHAWILALPEPAAEQSSP